MSCNKPHSAAVALGFALCAAIGTAHATSALGFAAATTAAPASAAARTASKATTVPASAPTSTAATPAQAAATAQGAAAPDNPGLTLNDVDRMARERVAQYLRSGDGASAASAPAAAPKTPAPPVTPTPVPVARPSVAAERTEPVSFVGGFSDTQGQHVLYEYNGAVYQARVGQPLLNGWVASKINGFVVTVSFGRRTWTVPMSAGSPPVPRAGLATATNLLGDLSAPLPPGAVIPGQVMQFGR